MMKVHSKEMTVQCKKTWNNVRNNKSGYFREFLFKVRC